MKKANRVRKLIIDQSKALTNETIRAQISCYADTLHQKRAFPPISSHAILLKARTLLVSPAIVSAVNRQTFDTNFVIVIKNLTMDHGCFELDKRADIDSLNN